MPYRDPLLECAYYLLSHGVKGNINFTNGAFHVGLYGTEPPPDIKLWNGIPVYYDRVISRERRNIDDDWADEP